MNIGDETQTKQSLGRGEQPNTEVNSLASPTADHLVQHLSDQLTEAHRIKAFAQLDLEWELERRQFCPASDRFPNGEVPTHSSAFGDLAAGALFLLGIGFVSIFAGFILVVLFFPIVALAVLLVAHGAQQYARASRYHRALARYESRRDLITHADFQPLGLPGCSDSNEAGDGLAVRQVADEVAETLYRAELARLDKDWEIEVQKHYIHPRRGKPYLPTSQMALVKAGVCLVIGLPMLFSKLPGFVAFGVLLVALGIGGGLYEHSLAKDYERALATHQHRRKQLSPEQFRPELRPSGSSTGVA